MIKKQSYIIPVTAAALGFFMALLDTTIVNVSLPKITTFYETTMDQISWIIDGYNIAFGVALLAAVRLADQFGRKRIFQFGIILFTISSLLCGLSQSIELLIIFRALQGLAGAMIVPVCIPLVLVHAPSEKVGSVTALFGIMAGIATALGPTIGGMISEHFSWQWVFYINIPIGIIAVVLIHIFVLESYDPTASKRVDWAGMFIISVSLFAFIYGLLQVKELGWSSSLVLSCLIGSAIGILLFILIELRSADPMLPVTLFKNYQFASGNIALLCLGIGMMCVYFLMAFYLTTVKGISQMQAGFVLSSSAIATMIITPITAKANKWGTKWFGVIGFILFAIGTFLLGSIPLSQSIWTIIGTLMIIGLGSGLIFSPLSLALIFQVPEEKAGIASGLFQVSRVIGAAIGVALLVVLLQHIMDKEMETAQFKVFDLVDASNLTDMTKEKLKPQLDHVNNPNHINEKGDSLHDVLNKLTAEEEQLLKTSPVQAHAKIKAQFSTEKERMKDLYPILENEIKSHVSIAFQNVFRLGSIVMLIGAIFAYLNGINAKRMALFMSERKFDSVSR